MARNPLSAAMNDTNQPRQALRVKAQREYFALGKDFLERGIKNNPDRPELYEALARLYKEKYKDHERTAEYYAKAATLPEAAPWANWWRSRRVAISSAPRSNSAATGR